MTHYLQSLYDLRRSGGASQSSRPRSELSDRNCPQQFVCHPATTTRSVQSLHCLCRSGGAFPSSRPRSVLSHPRWLKQFVCRPVTTTHYIQRLGLCRSGGASQSSRPRPVLSDHSWLKQFVCRPVTMTHYTQGLYDLYKCKGAFVLMEFLLEVEDDLYKRILLLDLEQLCSLKMFFASFSVYLFFVAEYSLGEMHLHRGLEYSVFSMT